MFLFYVNFENRQNLSMVIEIGAVLQVKEELTVKTHEETSWGDGRFLCLDKDMSNQ